MKYALCAAMIFAASAGTAFAASSGPDAVCHEKELTRQEQDLCVEQIKHAQNMQEQKAVQAKFRKRITDRQESAKK